MDTGTIGIFIGSVALVMTIAVPAIYVFLGKAEVSIEFNTMLTTTGKILQVEVYNRPYKNAILRCLNIKRGAVDDLVFLFDIKRRNNGEVVAHNLVTGYPVINAKALKYEHIGLQPSIVPLVVPIIEVVDGQVKILQIEQNIVLQPEIYVLYVHLGIDGKRMSGEKNFTVTANSPFADWGTTN